MFYICNNFYSFYTVIKKINDVANLFTFMLITASILSHIKNDICKINFIHGYSPHCPDNNSCGMSIETLMALSEVLNMSLDYLIYGKESLSYEKLQHTNEVAAILKMLNNADAKS